MLISIVIPCYNEEEVLNETYNRLHALAASPAWSSEWSMELLFVNDGSADRTPEILDALADKDQRIRVIHFSRNFGHQPAVSAGIHEAAGDALIIIDADLQDPPEVIPDMIRLWQEKQCHGVYAVRKTRKGEGIFKKISAALYYRLVNYLSDVHLPVDTGDFRLIDRSLAEAFKQLPERKKYIRGLISWLGFYQEPFYYVRDSRFAGETKYPLMKMLKFATTGIIYFSQKPLRLSVSLGFLSIVVGLLMAVYALVSKFAVGIQAIPGWTSLMIAVIFFGGIQLFCVGIIGEYIGSIFQEMKGRPEYVIMRKSGKGE